MPRTDLGSCRVMRSVPEFETGASTEHESLAVSFRCRRLVHPVVHGDVVPDLLDLFDNGRLAQIGDAIPRCRFAARSTLSHAVGTSRPYQLWRLPDNTHGRRGIASGDKRSFSDGPSPLIHSLVSSSQSSRSPSVRDDRRQVYGRFVSIGPRTTFVESLCRYGNQHDDQPQFLNLRTAGQP